MVGFTEVNPDKGTKTLVLSHKNIVMSSINDYALK